MSLLELIHWIILVFFCHYNTANYGIRVYTDTENNGDIKHLVVHKVTGSVYVGAVNYVYHLTPNLTVEERVETGPREDSPNCRPGRPCLCYEWGGNCEAFTKKPTESVNKGLVIDYEADRLIVCSNLQQGHCEKRWLSDITRSDSSIYIPLVNYDTSGSVVMFIAPGLTEEYGENNNVLYVAATHSTVGLPSYAELVPSLSSRNRTTFDLIHADLLECFSSVDIEKTYRDTFQIHYKAGFSSGGFNYFLTVQPEIEHNAEVRSTKIIRVCQNDKCYRSLVEMPLTCSYNGVYYEVIQHAALIRPADKLAQSIGLSMEGTGSHLDDVIFAIFTRHQLQESEQNTAVCIFPIRRIRQEMRSAIQRCFDGNGNTGPSHFKPAIACQRLDFKVPDDYCGGIEFNNPISGFAINTEATMVLPGTLGTGIVMTTTEQFTIAFVGTSDGQIKKVAIETDTMADNYETITLEPGVAVISDMILDPSQSHLYVATGNKVSKVKLYNCSQYTTCGECSDPYCGWCVLEEKCSLKRECPESDKRFRWLGYTEKCPKILTVIPPYVSTESGAIHRDQSVLLSAQSLPEEVAIQCVFTAFGRDYFTTTATVFDEEQTLLGCKIPKNHTEMFESLIQTGQDHLVARIGLVVDDLLLTSIDFTFFSCGRHVACVPCTVSAFPCFWCIISHRCIYNREICQGSLVTGQNVAGATDTPGPAFCPRIEESSPEILIANGEEKQVQLRLLHINNFMRHFRCLFVMRDELIFVDAAFDEISGELTCRSILFNYTADEPFVEFTLNILWGRPARKTLDNPDSIKVVVYRCASMAVNCGECLTSPKMYNCGWCEAENTCSHNKHCLSTPEAWLDTDDICPNPQILSIHPKSGPVEGGTSLTINGINLGIRFDDIRNNVFVGSTECMPLEERYVPATRIVCETISSSGEIDERVQVMVRNQAVARSEEVFSFVPISITDVTPLKGPVAGGTSITITGHNLDAGSLANVHVAGFLCNIDRTISNANLTCLTATVPNNTTPPSGTVAFTVDNAEIRSFLSFEYQPNPEIIDVYPLQSIASGGILITVEGNHLDSVNQAQIITGMKQSSGECTTLSKNIMICISPPFEGSLDATCAPVLTPLSFKMDGVWDIYNFSKQYKELSQISYSVDPTFEVCERSGLNNLEIQGLNISIHASKRDYRINARGIICKITYFSQRHIFCSLNSSLKKGEVNNLVIEAGNFKYELNCELEQPFDFLNPTIITCIVLVFVLIVTVIISIFICKKRLRKKEVKNDFAVKFERDDKSDGNNGDNAEGENLVKKLPDHLERLLLSSGLLIDSDHLTVLEEIGKGHFGCVYRGLLLNKERKREQIAIKSIRSPSGKYTVRDMDAFLEEALRMKDFSHSNVLKLIGISTEKDSGMPLIVLPFMEHGDLLSYIRDKRNYLSVKDLIQFGLDIAHGMDYLTSLKFVHRDLAARNCMLDKNLQVLVADFGLSRDVYDKQYYSSSDKKAMLPVKWMALESIEKNVYDVKSDVWSYGVVLWELLTRGNQPYPGVNAWEVSRYLASGRRMAQPEYCPKFMYRIMNLCWRKDPSLRPTFGDIASTIEDKLREADVMCSRPMYSALYLNVPDTQGYVEHASVEGRDDSTAMAFDYPASDGCILEDEHSNPEKGSANDYLIPVNKIQN